MAKRFYTHVTTTSHEGAFAIVLDGKLLRTPQKHVLTASSQALAAAAATEWQSQEASIRPETMPITRILTIACDLVPTATPDMLADMLRYGETDLVCYRDGENADIAATQARLFDPALDWLSRTHGITLNITENVLPVAQTETSQHGLRALVERASPEAFAALAMAVPLLGSLVLALALWHGAITPEHAITASRIEEDAHAQRYGLDAEVAALLAAKALDIRACAVVLATP